LAQIEPWLRARGTGAQVSAAATNHVTTQRTGCLCIIGVLSFGGHP
jgi:hypothetical protein